MRKPPPDRNDVEAFAEFELDVRTLKVEPLIDKYIMTRHTATMWRKEFGVAGRKRGTKVKKPAKSLTQKRQEHLNYGRPPALNRYLREINANARFGGSVIWAVDDVAILDTPESVRRGGWFSRLCRHLGVLSVDGVGDVDWKGKHIGKN